MKTLKQEELARCGVGMMVEEKERDEEQKREELRSEEMRMIQRKEELVKWVRMKMKIVPEEDPDLLLELKVLKEQLGLCEMMRSLVGMMEEVGVQERK